MALINSLSTPSIREQCDLFSVPMTDTSVQSSFYGEFKPLVNIQDSDSKVEIRVTGNSNQYLDLNDSFFYIKLKVLNGDGTALPKGANISTVNNFLHSIFQQCDVTLNNQLLSSTNNGYAFKSYFEGSLSYSSDGAISQGACALFYKDSDPTDNSDSNTGYAKRKAFIAQSAPVELVGKLRLDLASQNRYILNDTSVCLSLTRSPDSFALLYDPTEETAIVNPYIKLLDASFFVRKQILFPSIALSHQRMLDNKHLAQYPLPISDLKNFTIPSGNQAFVEENTFLGKVPSRVVIAMTSNAAFIGNYTKNPFNFQDFGLNYIALTVNNVPIPIRGLNVDFKNNQYMIPYYLLLRSLGVNTEGDGALITREDYTKGNVMFAYDINQVQTTDASMLLESSGSVKIELKFHKPLSEAVTLLVYSETQGILTLDKFRQAVIS